MTRLVAAGLVERFRPQTLRGSYQWTCCLARDGFRAAQQTGELAASLKFAPRREAIFDYRCQPGDGSPGLVAGARRLRQHCAVRPVPSDAIRPGGPFRAEHASRPADARNPPSRVCCGRCQINEGQHRREAERASAGRGEARESGIANDGSGVGPRLRARPIRAAAGHEETRVAAAWDRDGAQTHRVGTAPLACRQFRPPRRAGQRPAGSSRTASSSNDPTNQQAGTLTPHDPLIHRR
jgi:hypothetical protein